MQAPTTGQNKGAILVFSHVFPNSAQPGLGLFVRERMFRVARVRPLVVVAPIPWFPFQSVIRLVRPHFRPTPPRKEIQGGIEVLHPRFLSVPGMLKWLDGFSMAVAALPTLLRLKRRFNFQLIDSHFAFPDGYAATLLGRWLGLPVTITLRGTEVPLSRYPARRSRIIKAVNRADRVFAVANALKEHVRSLGARVDHVRRVGNGVDTDRFYPEDRDEARNRVGVPLDAKVMIGVGALCERKGFHGVLELIPELAERHPDLLYLIVGGAGPEGDWTSRLEQQASDLGVSDRVRFMGRREPDELRWILSAADLFVLATRNEGWANVFLEAMACGLPVVTTDVGGNREVISDSYLGRVVPFGDPTALSSALDGALSAGWDRAAITAYAMANSWSEGVKVLDREFAVLLGER